MAMTEGGDDVDASGDVRKTGAVADRGDDARERDLSRLVATVSSDHLLLRRCGDPVRSLSPHGGRGNPLLITCSYDHIAV